MLLNREVRRGSKGCKVYNKRVRIIDYIYIYIYSITWTFEVGCSRVTVQIIVYRLSASIVLCNTGRMTEAVLFSAKQAVHESERSSNDLAPSPHFLFESFNARRETILLRSRDAFIDDGYNLERILILVSNI